MTKGKDKLLVCPLDEKLSLSELVAGGVLNLKLFHRLGELGLDLSLGSALDFHRQLGTRDGLLDLVDVGLEVGLIRGEMGKKGR